MRTTLILATLIAFAAFAPASAVAVPLEPLSVKAGCHDGEQCDCPSLEDFEVTGAYDWINECRNHIAA